MPVSGPPDPVKAEIEAPGTHPSVKVEAPTPTTPPSSQRQREAAALLKSHTPPKLSATARRACSAGLVRSRPESGASVPVKAEVSLQSVKLEHDQPILGDFQPRASRKRARSAALRAPAGDQAKQERKAKSQREMRLKAARMYLAQRGVTYNDRLSKHICKAPLKGSGDCPVGDVKIVKGSCANLQLHQLLMMRLRVMRWQWMLRMPRTRCDSSSRTTHSCSCFSWLSSEGLLGL